MAKGTCTRHAFVLLILFSGISIGHCSIPPSLFCQNLSSEVSEVCYYCVNGTAVCYDHNDGIICRHGQVYIRNCYCATYNNQTNSIEFGKCVYNCEKKDTYHNIDDGYSILPQDISELNTKMCGDLHRSGTLCGRCEDTYYPMAFSYNMSCVKCQQTHWNWAKLASFVFVPLTLFCFIIIIFNINITSTYLHGFILFSQAVSIPAISRIIILAFKRKSKYLFFVKMMGSFYSIWNLDILRSFSPTMCFHIKYFDILTLDLAIGLYPLVLITITYFLISLYDRKYKIVRILWEPFHRLLSQFQGYFKTKTSIIDSFATVFVLSNVKFMSVCFDMLASIDLFEFSLTGRTHYKHKLFYDASTDLYSSTYRVFITHFVLIVFTIFPILLLLFYPFKFFQRLLNIIPVRWHILHTFVDVFQGGYKNGSDHQTRDFRWFSSFFLIIRLLIFVVYVMTLSALFFYYAAIVLVFVIILIIIIQPFKCEQDNYINIGFLLLLSVWYVGIIGMDTARIRDSNMIVAFYGLCSAVGALPVVFLAILLLHWIKKQLMLK